MPTLDLRNSTLQELFDTAVAGLRSQGCQPAFDAERETCQYRAPDGKKCAMGHLIPDENYEEHWDRQGFMAFRLVEDGCILANKGQTDLFRSLQSAHDDCTSVNYKTGKREILKDAPRMMERNLAEVADKYNLVYTPPETKKV